VANGVDLVLFDLGGVLIEVAGVRAMQELTGIGSEEELWRRWLTCRWVRRFESGRCSETEFAAGVVADWQLDLTASAFLAAFQDWPTGPLPGAAELVAQTRASVTTGCFSNTNTLHWHEHIASWPLASLFDHRFLSFELGQLKPDVAAFAQVAGLLEVPAGRVLFLDDNALNVAGAAAAGFQATRASGVGEARQRLAEAGVLSAAAGPKVSAADGSPWAIPASVARSVIEEDDRAMRNRP
jgi:putative hydrolase of the HAD superfamily